MSRAALACAYCRTAATRLPFRRIDSMFNGGSFGRSGTVGQLAILDSEMLTLPHAALKSVLLVALGFVALAIGAMPAGVAVAQERTVSDGLTMIALDTTMRQMRDLEAAQMAANLVLSQTPVGLIAVGEYGESPDDPRTFSTTEEAQQEIRTVIHRMRDAIETPGEEPAPPAALSTMLTRYASYMDQINAPPGSKLVLLSAGEFADPENTTAATVSVLADGFSSGGILVDGVSLATTAAPDRAVIEALANATGGRYFDLGFNDGVLEFLNATLGVGLKEIFRGEPTGTTPLTASIDVLPHSTTLVAGFVYEGTEPSTTLVSPSHQELTAGSTTVDVLSASGIHVFTVLDPEPGHWRMNSLGGTGTVLFVNEILNPIELGPPVMPPAPVGHPWTLHAESTADGLPHVDTTASLVAEVIGPGGVIQVFQMYDDGTAGDRLANDGIYAAEIGADEVAGFREVNLRMNWPVTAATVEGRSEFSLEPFPEASLMVTADPFGLGGEDMTLATIDVSLDGSPFPVTSADIELTVSNAETGEPADFAFTPLDADAEPASRFRVSADVLESTSFEISAILRLAHLERDFVYDIGVATVVAELDPLPPPNRTPLFLAGAVIVAVVAGIAVWWFVLRTSPTGYIYKADQGAPQELAVDFSEVRFALFDAAFRSNVVPAAALAGLPLRGGRFVFGKRRVVFRYNPEHDGDVRMTIEGEPIVSGRNQIKDGDQMVVAGVTYRFTRRKLPGDIRVSTLLKPEDTDEHGELARFTNDPMTFDAPSSIRPTRRS